MNPLKLSVAATLLISAATANATFHPMLEGDLFPDFDDPAAPQVFYLDDSGLYDYAGFFIGNVGRPGDPADHIAFDWGGLKPGHTVNSFFQAAASANGKRFDAGQGLEIKLTAEDGAPVLTMTFDSAHAAYTYPNFTFNGGTYHMTAAPLGLAPTAGVDYWISMSSPVPEPGDAGLAGLGIFILMTWRAHRRGARTR